MAKTHEAINSNEPRALLMLDNLTSVPSDEGNVVDVSSPAPPAAPSHLLGSSQASVTNASTGRPGNPSGEESGNGDSPWKTNDDTGGERVDESGVRRKGKGKAGAARAAAEPQGGSISSSGSSSAGGGMKDSRARSALGDQDIDIGEEGRRGEGDEGDARQDGVSTQVRRNDDGPMDNPLENNGAENGTHPHYPNAQQLEQTPKKGKEQGEQQLPTEEVNAPTPVSESGSGSTRKRKRPEALPLPQQKAPKGNRYNLWSGAILRKVCARYCCTRANS